MRSPLSGHAGSSRKSSGKSPPPSADDLAELAAAESLEKAVGHSILARLSVQARSRGGDVALWARGANGAFAPITWREYQSRVIDFAAACLAVGLPVGGAVAILGEGCAEWVIAALGAMTAGGIAAGVYHTLTPEQSAYVFAHCEAPIIVLDTIERWRALAPQLTRLSRLRRVVIVQSQGALPADVTAATPHPDAAPIPVRAQGPIVQSWADFMQSGSSFRHSVRERRGNILPDQVASLIYTSGTTGTPKGVMLTHQNIAWVASACLDVHSMQSGDVVVSYLPLCHIAEQIFTLYVPLTAGSTVYFAGGIPQLRETLLLARPTLFLAVPRVWEKLQAAVQAQLAKASPLQARVIAWARDVGLRAGRYRLEHGRPFGLLAIEEKIADKVLFQKVKSALGLDRVRLSFSGAAAIRKDVQDFFLSLGLPIYESYGQSESTGLITLSGAKAGTSRFGCVGKAMPGVQVRLAPDGEVLAQGPNLFAGYYKDQAATAQALEGGWLHTGDVGEFDADGFLRITDRKNDLFKTSGGKYIAPGPIEGALRSIPLVSQAIVLGEGRKFVAALLTLDVDALRVFAGTAGIEGDAATLAQHEKVRAHVQEQVDRINRGLARFETVKTFALLPQDFSQENDEVTPTQKLRRRVILRRHAATIDALYEGASQDDSAV